MQVDAAVSGRLDHSVVGQRLPGVGRVVQAGSLGHLAQSRGRQGRRDERAAQLEGAAGRRGQAVDHLLEEAP